eukprot:scaffold212546_cov13-Tisochrysis_lutea.AAC.1
MGAPPISPTCTERTSRASGDESGGAKVEGRMLRRKSQGRAASDWAWEWLLQLSTRDICGVGTELAANV